MTELNPHYPYNKLEERVSAFYQDVIDRSLCLDGDPSDLFFLYDLLIHERAEHKKKLMQAWYDGEDAGWWSCQNEDALAEGVVIARYNPYDPTFELRLDNGDNES